MWRYINPTVGYPTIGISLYSYPAAVELSEDRNGEDRNRSVLLTTPADPAEDSPGWEFNFVISTGVASRMRNYPANITGWTSHIGSDNLSLSIRAKTFPNDSNPKRE